MQCHLFSACNQAGLGVAAVFGPKTSMLASHINSMCNTLEVPHLESRLEVRTAGAHTIPMGLMLGNSAERQMFSVNVYPEASFMSKALMALIEHFEWKKFCILYGDQNGQKENPFECRMHLIFYAFTDLLLLQDILRAPLNSDVEITVRQAHPHSLRETLKEISKRGFHKVLAHLNIDLTYALLKAVSSHCLQLPNESDL